MGERKVVNKYLPPDFDPSLVPRTKKPKDGLVSVRMMLPFSIQCTNCSTFMYQGRKFNSKKESMQGADGKYLGIQRFRFYIKCTACSQPVSFCTDPQNADYAMESGATRNYELQKDKKTTEDTAAQEEEEEETNDPLKGLENRVLASQREMQDMDNLEEIKAMNMRHVKLLNSSGSSFDAKAVLEAIARNKRQLENLQEEEEGGDLNNDDEDDELVKSIQFGKKKKEMFKRLDDDDERASESKRHQQALLFEKQQQQVAFKAKSAKSKMPVITIKRRRPNPTAKKKVEEKKEPEGGLGGLLGGYGSDSDSD
mmetsp:Transcript_32000/g.52857  ORF Transcript_32000/g.52857 Transcript_32000/m.52857 type:complete len:311 (-) Transcript_32000:140-1072(-)|eukprot:CAMPEP_0119008826 /NCGR_PEP_ID=MMETSP1176-20130426/3970_1 /TAXON_ID=265551 /ORGANISM="Synedropsis recta cf, Strain CCMP1620" /LENGTH=310 /DNA_ID=CAMNT_0006961235 /DNA_START=33 /DNA_END=965 /DNA_ORIENTATION=-